MDRISGRLRRLGCGVAAFAAGAAVAFGACAADGPLVNTPSGPVQGAVRDTVRVFTAIPFAAPPVGPLRFRPPQPAKPWTKTLDATVPAPACPQAKSGDPAGKASETEDCLYLNVFAPTPTGPAAAKPMPVMVWIYGGGFNEGWSGAREYDGARLAKDGNVIVVSINYRLGLLGFLMAKGLDGAEESGNYGIRDQQEALRWVQKNIAAFGGDPNSVTIFGESAGATSVMDLLASPASKGLFQKAIAQSAGGAHTAKRADVEAGLGKAAIAELGCAGKPNLAACLRALPVSAFLKAKTRITQVQDKDILPVDPQEAFASGQFNHVPVLLGTNLLEGNFFVAGSERSLGRRLTEEDYAAQAKPFFGDKTAAVIAHYPSAKFGSPAAALGQAETDFRFACYTDQSRHSIAAYAPVWAYEMTEPDPVQQQPRTEVTELPNTDFHTSDLAYVFDVDANGAALTGRAATLSARWRRYWVSFAKIAKPRISGEWLPYTVEKPTVLGYAEPPVESVDFAARHSCDFLRAEGLITVKQP